jgi:predicted MPP superfamily phosphohydrolase
MQFVLVLAILFGHIFLWIGLLNRLHGTGISQGLKKILTLVYFTAMGLGPVVALWRLCAGENLLGHVNRELIRQPGWMAFWLYAILCLLAGVATLVRWICHRLRRAPRLLSFHRRRRVSITPAAAALSSAEQSHHPALRLPGNQALQLELTEWACEVPRLPRELDGLTVLHLSDLHFTGLIGKGYFREVVRVGNELKADLVTITGDFLDKAECLDWIPDILGRLTARYGVYAILGNHDRCVEENRLRQILAQSGMIDVGARWISVNIRGEEVIIAGNELPWYRPAADLAACPPRPSHGGQLRIALAHSPDQIDWARAGDIDLMLSGHTHGGQICFPIVGPIFSPTASGVKYISGLFYAQPTIFHVTRGISGRHPLRWNCRPEITLLTLHAPVR